MTKPQPRLYEKVMAQIRADVILNDRGIGDLKALYALVTSLEDLNRPEVTAQLEAFLPKRDRDIITRSNDG